MKSSLVHHGLFLVVLLLLPSCSTTRISETWKDAAYLQDPAKSLFVIAAVSDRGPRSLIEEAIVRELKSRGISATASTGILPEDAIPTREGAVAKTKELGSDGALIVRFVSKNAGESHTPGKLYGEQRDFDESWEDGGALSTNAASPEASYDFTVIRMKTLLYRTGSDKPVWSVKTRTTYQEHPFDQIEPFAAAVVRRLAQDGMIK